LFDYFARHNRYSEWEAYLRAHPSVGRQVARARTSGGRLFQRVPFKPLVFFLYSYVAKAGWRDGRAGFHYAVAHAFYFWQIVVKTAETET
jgi:hypothetical protein